MGKQELVLDGLVVNYNNHTGSIDLKIRDRKMKGKHFSVSLSSSSESYKTMFSLLREKGLVNTQSIGLPEVCPRITSTQELAPPGKDPRSNIRIGIGLEDQPLDIDLEQHSSILIAGMPGSGKTVALRNFILHGLSHKSVELRIADSSKEELKPYPYRDKDVYTSEFEESLAMLLELKAEMKRRYALMEKANLHSYRDTGLPALYLIVEGDSIYQGDSDFAESTENQSDVHVRELFKRVHSELMNYGRAAGIYSILSCQQPTDAKVLSFIPTRILMGSASSTFAQQILGKRAEYGEGLMRIRGRGIFRTGGGVQSLFQISFSPYNLEITEK